EDVAVASRRRLRSARGYGKVRRLGVPDHVDIALDIDSDPPAVIVARTAPERRVRDHGIDHEGQGGVVGADVERDPSIARRDVATAYGSAMTAVFLVHDGSRFADLAGRGPQHEIPVPIDLDARSAIESQLDRTRVRARSDDEVVLELP